ncbi:uncharacterized protein PHACADRAFT_180963 [Phanerochaete carnosa HHB-10118-sp]|uniref:Ubiquitin-like domain-containing protein n=1 Tax=Phanerochaete carnosa (strain HHB-10118-sp) TaxID=650164 RepID=K5W4U3_PHACS|nr:uncharacterized protein PHACADRAFT_180963 [Phanerochaete carnosa HHB-10118-sp]EKM58908.1 hypothetical protein PHACADRAFT_180963 [Phanerochaete carnosa HHB-10118-sp]
MSTHSSQAAQSKQNEETVEVVIHTDNAVGKPDRLVLHDVPFPVSFDYLAIQMCLNKFPELTKFSARTRVNLKVVEEPSSFNSSTLSGCINVDEPLCRYYHNHLHDVIDMPRYNTQTDVEGDALLGLSCAKIGERGDTVDVGGVSIAFMSGALIHGICRTLRVPENGKTYILPTQLGKFPLYNAADFASQLPQSIARKGGILMGMHQCEAMWINFVETEARNPYAVKVSTGGVNAITGMPKDVRAKGRQDYLTVGSDDAAQAWLDGFSTERGVVRQFVAVPTGHGLTIEAQITGKEMKPPRWRNHCLHKRVLVRKYKYNLMIGPDSLPSSRPLVQGGTYKPPKVGSTLYLCAVGGVYNVQMRIDIKTLDRRAVHLDVHCFDNILSIKYRVQDELSIPVDQQRIIFCGRQLEDDKTLAVDWNWRTPECRVTNESTLHLVTRLRGGGGVQDAPDRADGAGFAAGGKISQKIIRDRFSAAAYNFGAGCRLHVTIISPAFLSQLTGRAPTPTPISIKTYLEADLPWFALYDEGVPSANNVSSGHSLASIESLRADISKRRDANPSQYGCCYCAATATFQLQPCGHLLCQDCADGLPENECPKHCRVVVGRKKIMAEALAESEADWDCPAAGSSDERIVVLSRCAEKGIVGTFMRAADNISILSSDPSEF